MNAVYVMAPIVVIIVLVFGVIQIHNALDRRAQRRKRHASTLDDVRNLAATRGVRVGPVGYRQPRAARPGRATEAPASGPEVHDPMTDLLLLSTLESPASPVGCHANTAEYSESVCADVAASTTTNYGYDASCSSGYDSGGDGGGGGGGCD
jgi:hypothetical protein